MNSRAAARGVGAGATLAAVLLAAVANAAEPDCASGGCHDRLTAKPVVHEALSVASCSDCHAEDSAPKRPTRCKSGVAFKLTKPDPELCGDCHEVAGKGASLHGAITSGGCNECHLPHASDNPLLLKKREVNALCGECHEQGDGPNLHQALVKGVCTDCHSPHASAERPLLKKPVPETCGRCHDAEKLLPASLTHRHKPVEQGQCVRCHEPHRSENPKLLRQEGNALCLGCHDKKNEQGAPKTDRPRYLIDMDKKHVHDALTVGSCTDCHRGHGSKYQRLLYKPQPALCHDCHDRQDKKDYAHSAVRLGQCSACHEPHASNQKHLVRKDKPRDLCFTCHADDLTGRAKVHSPAGQDCMNCHHPHATGSERMLLKQGKELCYACHPPVDDYPVRHGAVEKFGCTACHDPHGGNQTAMLAKPVNELCTSCHPDQKDGTHVPGAMAAGGHKVTGGADPKRVNRLFSCASCHNPHGSDFQKLVYAGGPGMEACSYCHFSQDFTKMKGKDEGKDAKEGATRDRRRR